MNGSTDPLANLRRELGYDAWAAPAGDERVFFWGFFLAGSELPGWRLHRTYRIPGNGFPPALQSIWTHAGKEGALLRVDAFETASAAEARVTLLRLAGEVQAGTAPRRVDGLGEVALGAGREHALTLVRGNLVLSVHSASRAQGPVREEAASLDRLLAFAPDEKEASYESAVVTRRTLTAAGLDDVASRLRAEEQEGEPRSWRRFQTSAGEIVRVEGKLVFRPGRADADAGAGVVTEYEFQPVPVRRTQLPGRDVTG
jgi:hypothetical protein